MKIGLIGHGAMGTLIEQLAVRKGHEIVCVVDDADAGLLRRPVGPPTPAHS